MLDKISILEIKLSKIKDENLLKEVKKEYEILIKLKKENINSSQKINIISEVNGGLEYPYSIAQ